MRISTEISSAAILVGEERAIEAYAKAGNEGGDHRDNDKLTVRKLQASSDLVSRNEAESVYDGHQSVINVHSAAKE